LILTLIITPSLLAYGQPEQIETQDYLLIEVLLSMQGAVIGGGLGVLTVGQAYEAIQDCDGATDEISCLAEQEFGSLCGGYAMGVPAGAAVGLLLSEKLFNVQGDIGYALLGSMLGLLAGVPQCSVIGFLRQLGFTLSFNPERDSDLSLLLNPFMLSALGAVIGYNFDWIINSIGEAVNSIGEKLNPETKVQINIPLFEYRF
jgi:hypothetical protein